MKSYQFINLRIAVLAALIPVPFFVVDSQITVVSALCENKINPSGVNPEDIVFSWEMQSAERDVTQTAYQLVISSSEELLNAGKFDVYNTGLVKSRQNIQVEYKGKDLQPARVFYWKVRVWDNNNKPSGWCSVQNFTTGIFSERDWENAKWIAYEDFPDSLRVVPDFNKKKMNADNSKIVLNALSPLLRKEFNVTKKISRALLFICGLGHYEASINGSVIGDEFLSPGWTYYDKTALYNTYDITGQIINGSNTLGVILGNGFYNVSPERYNYISVAFGKPKMITLLKIFYADGSEENIITDNSWKTSRSPVTFNNIYGGEDYDARLEQDGWNTSAFIDQNWRQAVEVKSPLGKLLPETDYPVQILDSFKVKNISYPDTGICVFDFGQDVSGIVRIKVQGKAGQSIKLIPGELLDDNGNVDQTLFAPHNYTYTLRGDDEEIWQPRFSYFATRYVQVEGGHCEGEENSQENPVLLDMKLLHNRNSSPENGSFVCSNELFNRIYRLIDWAIKSNLQSCITDNPQREKLSWQLEQNNMRKSINYCYNVHNLYISLLQNLIDSQHESGLVPAMAPQYYRFPDPYEDIVEAGTAAILDPWFLYKFYGDTRTIKKAYPMMIKYAKYLEGKAKNNILSFGLGDWLDVGPLSPYSSLTPLEITATAYYYHAIHSLSRMAEITGKTNDENYYSDLAEKIRISFNEKFFDEDIKVYGTGSQTAMAIPLSLGIVEDKYRNSVLKNLVNSITAYGKILTAGDVGHPFLVDALYTNGQQQLLFDMTNRDDVPGYGYQLKKGATSLHETWHIQYNNSWNQLAMGHILEWFYGGIAGISQMENSVAFDHIKIKPQPVGDITHAKGSFHSPHGWIRTEWEKEDTIFRLNVEIPVNTKATVFLEEKPMLKVYINGSPVQDLIVKNKFSTFELGSGKYDILAEW